MSQEFCFTDAIEVAKAAAREAGQILLDWRERFTVREKSRFNLVTEADFAAQEAISQKLLQAFPHHSYLGEEGLNQTGSETDFRWIIDPLDGTGNYVHGFPYYCVSIGLEHRKELVLGVIYDPTRDEMFSVAPGIPADLNGTPIRVSDANSLGESMCVASLPVNSDPQNPAVARFLKVLPHAQTVQRLGSAALNLAYLACGRLEVFWSSSLKPWDMAAGVALVKCAGGVVTRINGSEFDVERLEVLSTCSQPVHQELIPLLQVSGFSQADE